MFYLYQVGLRICRRDNRIYLIHSNFILKTFPSKLIDDLLGEAEKNMQPERILKF